MKSLRSQFLLYFFAVVLFVQLSAAAIAIYYVHTAIYRNSAGAMRSLLLQKIAALNDCFDITRASVEDLSRYITENADTARFGTDSAYTQDFYEKIALRGVLYAKNIKYAKTLYFCPDISQYEEAQKCLYLMDSNLYPLQLENREFIDISFSTAGKKQSDLPFLFEGKTNGFPHWIGPYKNQNIEHAVESISFVSPIYIGGIFFGVVGIEINTAVIRSVLDNSDYDNIFGFLVSNDGTMICHRDLTTAETEALSLFFADEYADSRTLHKYMLSDEAQYLILGSMRNGMLLALSIPARQIFDLESQMLLRMIFLFVISLLITGAAVHILSTKIVRPIQVINDAASHIARGELNTKISVKSKNEIGMLSSSIQKIETELREYIAHIRNLAFTDFMTGCRNKSAFLQAQQTLEKRIETNMADFAVYVFDVNGLKRANDTLGHEAGDALIKGAAKVLLSLFGENDVYRTGGDEFVAVVQDAARDVQGTLAAFDEMIGRAEQSMQGFPLAVSRGAAAFRRGEDTLFKDVLNRADQNMYENKEAFYRAHESLRRR